MTTDANDIRSLLLRVRTILIEYGDRNLLLGVDAALAKLDEGNVDDVRSIYRTLLQSKGLLGDFYVEASEHKDAALLNKELSDLLDGLWQHLRPEGRANTAG